MPRVGLCARWKRLPNVRNARSRRSSRQRAGASRDADADIALLERQLGDLLGLKIVIAHKGTAGSVTLQYATLDQLDLICQRLSGESI